jgi:uncharacterized membrane protein (UPF0127 family)
MNTTTAFVLSRRALMGGAAAVLGATALTRPALAQGAVVFETGTAAIETHDGRRYDFTVEIAQTPAQRARGLMYRREMAPDHGMLFDFDGVRSRAMWMKNTYISLDILFLEPNGRIWMIAQETTPLSEKTILADGPIRAALELKAGTCRLLGIEVGDLVRHPIFGTDAGRD